ncbi:MAG: T9SS type A sorting domain-containing protein [Bacteroidota bacterium]|nr:T9SS type A sorting domain-containing protein [Bacteroidota bacterium]
MKKPILLFTILISINAIIYSQACLPDGITFNTQAQIDSFQTDYPGCTEIAGSVSIHGNDITNLNGLNNITSIGGRLGVYSTNNLNNLEGLNNLTSLGGPIMLNNNNSLTSISALSNTAFSNADDYWQFIEITDNNTLINLEGLNNIDTVVDRLIIEDNESLTSLSGLQNLKYVSGYFQLNQNDALVSLEGLNNLNCIEAIFMINGNDVLTDLEGLNNLTTLMRGFSLQSNNLLISLSGLDNLTFTKGINIVSNPILTDISALANVEPDFIDDFIVIKYNPSLMECDIESICNYLFLPDANVDINNNATGCNSEEEVMAACTEGVSEINPKPVFTIYPNPATNNLFISNNNELVNAVTIYNQLGKKVIVKTRPIDKIDVSMLKQGIYVIELVSNKYKTRHKLIIQ